MGKGSHSFYFSWDGLLFEGNIQPTLDRESGEPGWTIQELYQSWVDANGVETRYYLANDGLPTAPNRYYPVFDSLAAACRVCVTECLLRRAIKPIGLTEDVVLDQIAAQAA